MANRCNGRGRASAALLGAVALLAVAPRLAAQAREWSVEHHPRADQVGRAVDWVVDLDGDGLRDLVTCRFGSTGNELPGALLFFSSATGTLLREVTSPVVGDDYGYALAAIGDLDGDGFDEIAVSAPGRDAIDIVSSATGVLFRRHSSGGGLDFGGRVMPIGDVDWDGIGEYATPVDAFPPTIALISGTTGAILRTHTAAGATFAFGWSFCDAGDVDGDQVPDLAVTDWVYKSASGSPGGVVFVFSGAYGNLLRTLTNAQGFGGSGAISVAAAGDLDGDGYDDLLIGGEVAGSYGGVVAAASGFDGHTIWLAVEPPASQLGFGSLIVVGGDFDGDGDHDVATGASRKNFLHYFDLATGAATGSVALPAHCGAAAAGDDLDGDGSLELLVGMPSFGTADHSRSAGIASVRSGIGGQPLLEIEGIAVYPSLGIASALLSDRDGDGWRDLAIGAPWGDGDDLGFVRITSGRTGAELSRFVSAQPLDEFGMAIAVVGDQDGDAIEELLVGAPSAAGGGRVELRSGGSGATLASWSGPAGSVRFGQTIAAAPDVNGASRAALGDPGFDRGGVVSGRVELIDLASGASLGAQVGGVGTIGLGAAVEFIGDTTGDGVPELAVGAYDPTFPWPLSTGELQLWNGIDATLLWTWIGTTGDEVGETLASIGDFDGDAIPDLLTGLSWRFSATGTGLVTARSGLDGSPLCAWEGPTTGDSTFGASLAHLGDIDGDGADDFAVGAPNDNEVAHSAGSLHVFSSRSKQRLKRLDDEVHAIGFACRLLRAPLGDTTDVDGDDVPDLGVLELSLDGFVSSPHTLRFSLYRLGPALLSIEPPLVAAKKTVTGTLCGGPPSAAAAIFLVDLGGAPVGQFLAIGALDAMSTLSVTATVPTGLSGLDATLRGYVIGWNGRVVASPDETLHFK